MLCAAWAIGDEAARNRKRPASSMAELQDVCDTRLPYMDAIIQYLNGRPLARLTAS